MIHPCISVFPSPVMSTGLSAFLLSQQSIATEATVNTFQITSAALTLQSCAMPNWAHACPLRHNCFTPPRLQSSSTPRLLHCRSVELERNPAGVNEAQLRQLQVQTLPCLGVEKLPQSTVFEICLSSNQESERSTSNQSASISSIPSVSSTRTQEWEEKYAQDGCVDLWVEEEFNAGSRLAVCPSR